MRTRSISLESSMHEGLEREIMNIRNRDAFLANALDCPVPALVPAEMAFTHNGDLAPGNGLEKVLRYGWYEPEEWGVWSSGKRAALRVPLDSSSTFPVPIELWLAGFVPPGKGQSVTISINGRSVTTVEFEMTSADVIEKVIVHASDLSRGPFVDIEFDAANVVSPLEAGTGSDPRKLGIAMKRLRIVPDCPGLISVPDESRLRPGSDLSPNRGLERILRRGWSSPEPWGTWSRAAKSLLHLAFDRAVVFPIAVELELEGFVRPGLTQTAAISVSGRSVAILEFQCPSHIRVETIEIHAEDLSPDCSAEIAFDISNPIAPAEIGPSTDRRKLGVAIRRLRIP